MTLQYCHVAEALPVLNVNCSSRIVLVGNNMEAREALLALQGGNSDRTVAFGFQSTGGRRDNKRVVSIHLTP